MQSTSGSYRYVVSKWAVMCSVCGRCTVGIGSLSGLFEHLAMKKLRPIHRPHTVHLLTTKGKRRGKGEGREGGGGRGEGRGDPPAVHHHRLAPLLGVRPQRPVEFQQRHSGLRHVMVRPGGVVKLSNVTLLLKESSRKKSKWMVHTVRG